MRASYEEDGKVVVCVALKSSPFFSLFFFFEIVPLR